MTGTADASRAPGANDCRVETVQLPDGRSRGRVIATARGTVVYVTWPYASAGSAAAAARDWLARRRGRPPMETLFEAQDA